MATRSWRGVFLGGAVTAEPSAPDFPSENHGDANAVTHTVLNRTNTQPGSYNPSANFSSEDPNMENPPEGRSAHIFYAVELLIFVFVGWGWLAIREYMGRTPALDVATMISVMVCTIINFVLALAIPSQMQFTPCAQAYFTHSFAVWVFYIYSLSESTRVDTGTLCCVDSSGKQASAYSTGPTHAAAFFGGLPVHQVPGVVSVAYLSVMLLIAGAQARACTPLPKDWVVRGLGLSITSMVALHLGVYLLRTPLCNTDRALAAITILLGIAAVILILDLDWVAGMVYKYFLIRQRTLQQKRDYRLIRSSIQTAGVGSVLFFCFIVALVTEKSLSPPLLIVFIVCLVSSCLGLAYDAVTLYGSSMLGVNAWEPEPEPEGGGLGTRMRKGVHVNPLMMRSRSVDSRETGNMPGPFLKRYPIFLQGQLNRGKKSY